MGDIVLKKAEYVVGSQLIDLMNEMNADLEKNYGELNVVVSALDAKLRKDNRIAIPPNDPSLAQSIPKLTIEYIDSEGSWHIATAELPETLHIGERTAFGKMIQKPGDVLWSTSIVVGQWTMVFVVATMYALVVLWTFKQWEFMQGKFEHWNDVSVERFGPIGFVIAVIVYGLFWIFRLPSDFLNPSAPDGWMLKWFVMATSAIAPIPGFLIEFIIWMTVVRNLGKGSSPSPGASVVAATDALSGLAGKLPSGLKTVAAAKGLHLK
jgi:hypothetical protein